MKDIRQRLKMHYSTVNKRKRKDPESWIIQPGRSFADFNVRQIAGYKYLLFCLVRRDITALYKQTLLGPLWVIIQPLITTAMYTVIFGVLANISTDGLNRPLFYLTGIITWNYFAECLNRTSTVFKDNTAIFGKVYFPRIILPLSIVLSLLFRFAIQLLLLLTGILFFHFKGTPFHGNRAMLLLPLTMLLMAFQGLGIGITIAALTVRYKDLTFLLSFAIQLLMYASPVIYPLSAAPDDLKWIILINPMTAVIETFRYAFLGCGNFSWINLLQSAASSIFLLLAGLIVFHKAEKNFIDHI